MKRAVPLFVLGAVVGTLGDRIHTYWDVLSYPHPVLFEEAWWVPLLFGVAGIVLVGTQRNIRRWCGEPAAVASPSARRTATRELATTFAWFAGAYLSTGLFKAYPVALTAALVASFVARALARTQAHPRSLWWGALAVGVGGPLFEAALSATGAFAYARPHLWGVPMWLAALYLHAALFVRALERVWPE
jgi:hypothetical protein